MASVHFCRSQEKPRTVVADQTVKLSTGIIEREWAIVNGVLQTTRIRNLDRKIGWLTANAAEFVVMYDGGKLRFTSVDFKVVQVKRQQAGQVETLHFELIAKHNSNLRLSMDCTAKAGQQFSTKSISVQSPTPLYGVAIEWLAFSGSDAPYGFGTPNFLADNWFVGVEHPTGRNSLTSGVLVCSKLVEGLQADSVSAVIGCQSSLDLSIEDSFQRYIATIAAPVGPQLQYNSWFDLRGKEVTPGNLLGRFESFRKNLLESFGLRLDALVVDDGFQNPNSIWEMNGAWQAGIAGIREHVGKHNGRLGLWLPLNGHMLNVGFDAKQGLEISNDRKPQYCLGGEKYRTALKTAITNLQQQGNFAYFKHDFNFLRCSQSGHGHSPTVELGRQAAVDGQLEILDWEKSKWPGLVRNLTSDIWLSPWWLKSAEFLYVGGADYGQSWRLPTGNPRAPEMTFRDIEIYRRLQIERTQIPLHRLMTHGLIRGKYEAGKLNESDRDWSDYVMWFFARGTMLHELYLTPDDMPPAFWPILGKAICWARANAEVFRWSRMIGGNPEAGAVYGFVHWAADKGIVALRNPSTIPVKFRVPFSSRPGHMPKVRRWHPVVIYPYRSLPMPLDATGELEVEIGSDSILLVELYQSLPSGLAKLSELKSTDARFLESQSQSDPAKFTLEAFDWNEKPPRLNGDALHREKSLVHAGFQIENAAGGKFELWSTQHPAAGARLSNAQYNHKPQPTTADMSSADGRSWLRQVIRNTSTNPEPFYQVEFDLPPTPAYSEKARVEATIRVRARRPANRSFEVPRDSLPSWPSLVDGRERTFEFVVIPEMELFRRRAVGERLFWIAVLAGLPGLALLYLKMNVGRHFQSAAISWIFGVVAFAAWLCVLGLTPLGVMLWRVL